MIQRRFHGAQPVTAQGIQHPGIHAPATAQFLRLADPKGRPIRQAAQVLSLTPLPQSQIHIADIGSLATHHLTPGQTDQQAVGAVSRHLGMGGHIGIAVDRVVALESVGAVVLPDFRQGVGIDGIAHGITHRQTQ